MNVRNNPLNLKNNPANPWKGSIGTDDRGHAIFADPAMGVRAAMRNMQKIWDNGGRSIAALIAIWAPADDTIGSLPGAPPNDPGDYAGYVSRHTGIAADAQLPDPRQNPAPWTGIIRAMARFEMGEEGGDCPWSVIMEGMAFWMREFGEQAKTS